GFEVMRMVDAARRADFIVTATGDRDVVTAKHLRTVKDGCVLANAGHFNVEVSVADLEKMATKKRRVREFVDEYSLRGGKKVYVLGEGRLAKLAAGQGHRVAMSRNSSSRSSRVMRGSRWSASTPASERGKHSSGNSTSSARRACKSWRRRSGSRRSTRRSPHSLRTRAGTGSPSKS